VVSESTMQELDEAVTLRPLETIKLKGKKEALQRAAVIW
jgi:hypothetical protein